MNYEGSAFSSFKKYDIILNNKQEPYEQKIKSLVDIWRNISELDEHIDIKFVVQIIDWAKLHTLYIVLTAEWKHFKAQYEKDLLGKIEKSQEELRKFNSVFPTQCQKLIKVVRTPWEDPVLERLLQTKDASIGQQELDFFCAETTYLVSVRLKKLCESQCEDLALNLVTAFMNCNKLAKEKNSTLNATDTQLWFIFDIYIALLYKFQENQKIVALLKELSLEQGLQLIHRFSKKRVKILKIWKYCHRIAILASQVFVSTAAVKFSEEHRDILEKLVETFIFICNTDEAIENFTKSLRRISQLADAAGLYVFCDVVHRRMGLKLKPFTIEMYIRALTADMNNLERQKNDNETDKVIATSKKLAEAFCKLADILGDNVNVVRECVLTAFSLEPTKDRLRRIEDLARKSGFEVLDTGQEWKCKLHPPMLPSDEIAWQCMECGEWMCKPQLNVPLNTNTALNDALATGDLGISPQLCDDLVVCLSNPRYQVLSWLLDWQGLHRLCVMYLNDPERTKNIVTELKFVDIDYSMFRSIKKEPVDELAGIEPGYEQYLDHDFSSDDQMSTISEDSASQESRPYSLGSDGSGDLPFNKFHLLPFNQYSTSQSNSLPPIQQKSDPNTLKSLRMFRPNLKRQRQSSAENGQSKKSKYDAASVKHPFPPSSNTNGIKSSSFPNFYNPTLNYPRVSNNQTNNFETASKNAQVATLPTHPIGGQVAQINHPPRHNKNLVINPLVKCSIGIDRKQISGRILHTTLSRSVNQQPNLDHKSISSNTASNLVVQLTKPEVALSNNSSNSFIFPRHNSTLPNQAPAASRCIMTTPSSALHTASMVSSNNSQSQNEFKSMEKMTPCNSFKGISVQDILEKSIDNCDENNKDVNLFSNFDGTNIERAQTETPQAPKLLIKLDKQRNFSSAIIDPNLPKNYSAESGPQKMPVCMEDCFKPNVNSPVAAVVVDKQSAVIMKDLKVILCRMNTTRVRRLNMINGIIKNKCDKLFMKRRKSENKPAPKKVQKKLSSSPLQDVNERVPPSDEDRFICDLDMSKKRIPDSLNPRVMLERLPSNREYARSVLANIPGLNDYQMLQPNNVDQIVNVVQISGGRPTSNVTAQNTQTSTQVTPHIQRIGQPRVEKPESTDQSTAATTISTATTTTAKPTTSQPSTLINILSQQVRPTQSNCVRSRPSPLINIFSQQIVRPATQKSAEATKVVTQTTETITTVKNSAPVTVAKNSTPTASQGTILQFICSKSSLPKFQQAFGKTVYNNRTTETEVATTTTNEGKVEANKTQTKNIPVNVQPIQGGVIYTRQMPVGQTINLIPPGRGQVFRIATSNAEQISLVKDTVIHSKMSALLAAALQGNKQKNESSQCDEVSDSDGTTTTRVTVTRPTLVQNARIVKPVLQIPSNVIRSSPQSNLSSTTLEQLREFDMVYKQIKERSSTSSESSTQPESSEPQQQQPSPQRISVTYVNQGQKFTQLSPVVVVSSYCNLQAAASPALSVTSQGSSSPCVTPAPTPSTPKVAAKTKGKSLKTTTASKSSPIPKPQQKPQEDEHTTQRIFDILAEYAEQLRNSPDLNNKPAPRRRSNPPTNPNQNSKRKKSSGSKKSGQCSSMSDADTEDQRTMGSEDSSCGVVQLSVPDEEQPVQSTVATTESNDSNSSSRQLILTDSSGGTQTRNLIIADSSVGEALKMSNTTVLVPGNYIMPVSMVKGGQQIAVVSGGSKILATVPARSGPNMLLFQSFLNQNRKTGVSTVKYSSIQPLSGISSQSIAGVSAQPPVILPPNSHNLTAVTLGQPLTIKKVESSDRNTELLLTISPQEPQREIKEVVTAVVTAAATPVQQPDSTSMSIATTAATVVDNAVVATVAKSETVVQNAPSTTTDKIQFQYQAKPIITAPIATPVIAQATTIKEDDATSSNLITMNISADNLKETKNERVQSVLVTACTSNGPMLSHTPPRYRKPSDTSTESTVESTKEEFLHNGEKPNSEQKHFHSNTVFYTNKSKKAQSSQSAGSQPPPAPRLDRDLHQMQRKQAALERELRLQKSLSEECEDLGVDEPSTSDLFPEADLLFDANNSPSFDQTSQDLIKRPQDIKETAAGKMGLFSDDDNSSSLRTDLFEYVEFQTENELEYQNQQLTNGQNTTESGNSSCEDSTLLQNCASMSDVTLNSPISPDLYSDNPATAINKYKFKYTNKKKEQQAAAAANDEILSSEDTTGSVGECELKTTIPDQDAEHDREVEEISCKSDCNDIVESQDFKSSIKGSGGTCEGLHCHEEDSPSSGRGARRSVRKLCSCCNGNEEQVNAIAVATAPARKRPNSRPHTPAPHKKATFLKKR